MAYLYHFLIASIASMLSEAFIQHHYLDYASRPGLTSISSSSSTSSTDFELSPINLDDSESTTVIKAPLKFIGPYPTLGLSFPNLATSSQRARNVTGVSLDFVVDTAANTNTINGQVAEELHLEIVGDALPGMGSSGAISGGYTYQLGDTQLEGVFDSAQSNDEGHTDNEQMTFMTNLTASALPVASPASAGLMSLAFLQCFAGGVVFDWGPPSRNYRMAGMEERLTDNQSSITFFAKKDVLANKFLEGMTRVEIMPIPVTLLPSIMLRINGIDIPALLDTGSPITVLNSEAAKQAGIKTIQLPGQNAPRASNNPFVAVANRFKETQAMSKAISRGDVVTIGGMNGPVNLIKSLSSNIDISVADSVSDKSTSFGQTHVYVGDIPGLAALDGLGVDAPPAVVLGMDVLRRKSKMFLRAQDNEVYF